MFQPEEMMCAITKKTPTTETIKSYKNKISLETVKNIDVSKTLEKDIKSICAKV